MGSDTAALLVIIELRQRVAALESENAELRQLLAQPAPPPGPPGSAGGEAAASA